MTTPKIEIVRTKVEAKSRKLDATWTLEKPQPIKWISVNMAINNPKFVWLLHRKSSLMLEHHVFRPQADLDAYLDQVQAWCQATGNGRRTSYDTFHFSKPAKMTAFLLRWNNG